MSKLENELESLQKSLKNKEIKEKEIEDKFNKIKDQLEKMKVEKEECLNKMDKIGVKQKEFEELVIRVGKDKDKYDSLTEEQLKILEECMKKEDALKHTVKTLK